MTCGIYELRFASGKRYIGCSVRAERRISTHNTNLREGRHVNPKLTNAFKKYKSFEAKILLICRPEDLLLYEQIFFDALKPELNCSLIAGKIEWDEKTRSKLAKARIGMKPDEATLQKMKIAQLGRKRSPESIEKARLKLIGSKRTKATRKILSEKAKLRVRTQDHCDNISKAKTGKPWSAARRLAFERKNK